ncbi:glycine cleavage system H protein [Rhinocladiella mackenziei CBS 650.93]|uniref:Glycine cleavage system H protein n=1 Tax=Rhinocladiella mackenziei CBS 650.93 TaxID=1442369 RepID=A0A0D2G2M4_9EURO|nr:glycine cleavage system H protein [Rhinocladiella mackenziei CBS 650.93]KIX08802.1 glycine cleavage system H protein [Rhinocladiella mackenziei CBS 650.93]
MSSSALRRLVPTVSKLATQRVALSSSSVSLQSSQWACSSRRHFTARSAQYVKKYTEDHEWIELDTDGKTGTVCNPVPAGIIYSREFSGTIGISEYAAQALGDVVYVELPELGMDVSRGDTIGAVESVKSASDIMTPVSGKITDHNKILEEKPGTINKSPEAEGWLAKIEVSDTTELDNLMSKEEYDNFEKE